VGQKVSPFIIAISFSTANQLTVRIFGTNILIYGKFSTGQYIASPPNTVSVTALPCKILTTTLPMFVHVHYH